MTVSRARSTLWTCSSSMRVSPWTSCCSSPHRAPAPPWVAAHQMSDNFVKRKCLDGYEFVESTAPEYDQTSGVAIYWRDTVGKLDFVRILIFSSERSSRNGNVCPSVHPSVCPRHSSQELFFFISLALWCKLRSSKRNLIIEQASSSPWVSI